MIKRFSVCIILILSMLLASCKATDGYLTCKVMLPDGDGYEVYGEQIVNVPRGSDVEFEVGILPGYEFESCSKGSYADGILTISNVKTGTTIRFNCISMASITRTMTNGNIQIAPLDKSGKLIVGSRAEVSVTPVENYYLDEVTVNGELINKDKNIDGSMNFEIVLEKEVDINAVCLGDLYGFSFKVYGNGNIDVNMEGNTAHYGDTLLFEFTPNDSSDKLNLVKLNGKRVDISNNFFEVEVNNNVFVEAYFIGSSSLPLYYYENLSPDESPLEYEAYSYQSYANLKNFYSEINTRPGYVCAGFNTQPDGSGDGYNFGALLYLTREIHLYAQWVEETSPSCFLTEESAEGYTIKGFTSGYLDGMTELVIPNLINGIPVVAIAANAFENNENIINLVLGNNITFIGESAFKNCTELKKVIFTDSVSSFPENAFDGCVSLSVFELNSIYDELYSDTNCTSLAYRFAFLNNKDRESVYILVSGSSGRDGINSEYFNSNMDKKILVIGSYAGMGINILLTIVSDLAQSGDTIIISPEYFDAMYAILDGSIDPGFVTNLAYIYKNPNVVKNIDFRYYTTLKKLIPGFHDKSTAVSQFFDEYEYDEYGTRIRFRPNNAPSYYGGNFYLNPSLLNDRFFALLSFCQEKLLNKGAKLYFSFPPANENAIPYIPAENIVTFKEQLISELDTIGLPLISVFEDYLFAGYLFYDADYHLSTEGATLRTIQLINDIKAQQVKEGN